MPSSALLIGLLVLYLIITGRATNTLIGIKTIAPGLFKAKNLEPGATLEVEDTTDEDTSSDERDYDTYHGRH